MKIPGTEQSCERELVAVLDGKLAGWIRVDLLTDVEGSSLGQRGFRGLFAG